MTIPRRILPPAALLAALLAACAMTAPAPLPTVPGPEATDLLAGLRGHFAMPARNSDGLLAEIQVLSLPDRAVSRIAPALPFWNAVVHGVSGPENGRLAFVQGTPGSGGENVLKVVFVDGSGEREVARRSGRLGERIALDPSGDRLALVASVEGVQMPGAYLMEGVLEIREVGTGLSLPLPGDLPRVLEDGIAWTPDGGRLAFVALLERSVVPFQPGEDNFGGGRQGFAAWDRVPAVCLLDVAEGGISVIHAGVDPVVAADGKSLLLCDFGRRYRRVDLATRKADPVRWPGAWGRAIALLAGDLVLHQGLPTEGAPVVRSPYGSFRAGLQTPPLKVARIGTDRFQTILEAFDPRHPVSFGPSRGNYGP